MKSIATKSPLLLPAIVLVVFIGEAIVMAILHACGLRGIWDIVLDPLLLAVLVAPVLLLILPRLGAWTSSHPEEGVPATERTSRWGIVAALGMMGGIAVLVLAGLAASHATFERETIKRFQEHQLAEARGLAASVQEIFEEVEQDLRYLARVPDLVAVTPDAQEELDAFFETHSDVLNNITRADAAGNQILRSPASSSLKNISHWPAFAAARDSGAVHVSEPQLCIIDQGVQVVRVTVPIDDQGKFAGVLYASIHLANLWYKCLPRSDTGRASLCWVIEDGGEILYDTAGRYTGRTWEQVEHEWHAGGAAGSEEEEAAEENLRRRVQSGEEGTAVYRNNLARGVDELMAFAPIRLGNERYGLAVATPKTEIAGPIEAGARVTYALMVGMLLFLGISGYIGLRGARARAQLLAEQRHAAERKQAGEERERLLHDMEERVKELRCLHGVADSIRERSTLEDVFQDVAALLPPGWRYPEITRGRIHFDGKDYVSEPFERTRWSQTSDIIVGGERRGFVEACYLEQRPDLDEGPFLKEERNLINSITHALSEAAERKQAEAAVAAHTVELEQGTIELEKSRRVAMGMMEDTEAAKATLQEVNARLEVQTARASEMAARAEMASAAKSEFLANMSHEIRTPMTAILGFGNVVYEETACCTQCPVHASCEKRTSTKEAIETIKRNGEYLLGLINDVLDLSKIEAGKMTVECIACRPCRIVAEVASLMRVRAEAKGIALKIEYVGPIPETIQSDPTRVRQTLINLIGNAIKFTEVGEVRLISRFVDDGSGPVMQFDVVDTGLGMTEEQAARLFQSFTQADASTTRKFGGTGLGLAICKRLTEMLGGNITVVESEPGVGTRMRVTVATGPLEGVKMLADPLAATVLAAETTAAPSADRPALESCRILLAEDGPDNRRLIAHILKKAGAEVTVVGNGKLAADAALAARDDGNPFDAILMDMQMPVMDGYEATGLLRRQGYTGPIIALTAHAMERDRQKCLDAGCDDYASKPINRKKLIETVRQCLRTSAVAESSA